MFSGMFVDVHILCIVFYLLLLIVCLFIYIFIYVKAAA